MKGKVHPITGYEGPVGEHRDSSTLSLTSEPEGGEWSICHAPATLHLGKRPGIHFRGD